MQVRVLFFGMLKDLAGRGSDCLSLPEGSTLGDVLSLYQGRIPGLKNFSTAIAMSLNQEYAGADAKLHAGDEIGLLPPVSGGSGSPPDHRSDSGPRVAITREKIRTQEILDRIKQPEDGAVVVFEGMVRNHTRNRRTLYLDYEAYEEMAGKQLESLAAQAAGQFAIRDAIIVHRLGRLQIGETSVLIAVASAHRSAAFDACHWLIDTLKRTVPIWKKEYFEDGAVWADGEPFPAEVPRVSGSPVPGPASK